MKLRACVVVGFLSLLPSLVPLTVAQTTAETASALPRLVRFAGAVKDLNGDPLTGVVGITFALYSEQTGGAALWLETQNLTADTSGHYVALLGSTKPDGLPAELFTSEQARWVGVQVSGQAELARVLLVSAPYALKAGDAETIGGLPPSAFVLAAPASGGSAGLSSGVAATASSAPPAIANTSSDVTTTGGTVNAIPLFTTSTNIQNSIVTQTGTTTVSVAGALKLPATGAATSTAGKDSQPQDFVASSFNSSTNTAENQTFQWRAEPASNDTTSPSSTLNLLYGLGATTPAETGLKLSSTGVFAFASGQTFPGTGTITGITTASGSGLSGGGTTGTLSLKVPSAGIANAMLANSKVTLNSGTGIKAPGVMTLGDTYTVSINTAVVPQLAAANTFTNTNTFNNPVTINANPISNPALQVTNTSGTGIQISAPGSDGTGVLVENAGIFGVSGTGNYQGGYFYGASGGSYSQNDTDSDGAVAAYAYEFGTTQANIGFWGYSASATGIGVYGQGFQASTIGQDYGSGSNPIGVWGDTGETGGEGVLATADDGVAVFGGNKSSSGNATAEFVNFENTDESGLVLTTFGFEYGGGCNFDVSGNLSCTGKIGEVAPVDGGSRKVALNSVQSPEAWFEDAGSGQLSGGQAVVNIESVFGQTINTGVEYHVFLTPNGDCKGLYVAEKSAASFVVKELGGGTSSIAFDYRIMAKRKSFENVRLTDVTKAMTINRPVKSAANAKHLPSAQSIRKQVQEHAKLRTAARLSAPVSNKKQ